MRMGTLLVLEGREKLLQSSESNAKVFSHAALNLEVQHFTFGMMLHGRALRAVEFG
jgi:hypothetical protein